MVHTTTATATYTLVKYSRSYPTTQLQSTSTAEWQHFTNPIIQLTLDVTKNSNAELLRVRLRVIWTFQNGTMVTINDNANIVLEDLDLLAFSNLSPRQDIPTNIPLKAVYKDTTIGMRYLHPLDGTNTTVFRRFQVSFANEHDTNAFINSTRTVCPYRMSPNQTNQPRQKDGIANPGLFGSSLTQQYLQRVGQWQTQGGSQTTLESTTSDHQLSQISLPTDSCNNSTHSSNTHQALRWPAMPPPSAPLQSSFRTSTPQIQATEASTTHIVSTQHSVQQVNNSSQSCIPPNSSQTVTAVSLLNNANQPAITEGSNLIQTEQTEPSHQILAALKDATSIYDLSSEHLEHIVGDVIREDGFTPLLEKLNQLWRIKSLIKITHDISLNEHTT